MLHYKYNRPVEAHTNTHRHDYKRVWYMHIICSHIIVDYVLVKYISVNHIISLVLIKKETSNI